MIIGLMGFEFYSANKGCEALTYSILSILNNLKCVEDNSIMYNFSGTGLGLLEKDFPKFRFIEIPPRLRDSSLKFIRSLKKCDIILDITMGDSFSDIYSISLYNNLIRNKRIAQFFCKSYILLPQTYGPFNNKKSEKKASKVFQRSKKIYCRDEPSKDLLEKIFNIKNSELVTDLAFILPYQKIPITQSNKIRLGINVSGLLYKGGFYSQNQFNLTMEYKSYIDQVINYFTNKTEYEIHLIPHVINKKVDSIDDDYIICKLLKKKYSDCILAPEFNTPIEAKSYISNMDIFIGSRMHSTIASFSSGVITIPLSYSRKFEGLFYSIDYPFVINGKLESTSSALDKTIDYVTNCDQLRIVQEKAIKIINKKINNFISSLYQVMNDVLKETEVLK